MSRIEWTDATWNPTTGCDRVSPGCDHCYAMTQAKRLKAMGSAKYQRDGAPPTSGPGFGLTVHPDALDAPLGWKKPRRVFVNSMSDLFHMDVPEEFLARVFGVMGATPRHTYQILTKRHARMRAVLSRPRFAELVWNEVEALGGDPAEWPLPNVWVGVSAEDQRTAEMRIPQLLGTPAAVRFISAEPLLGPVKLRKSWVGADPYLVDEVGVDWVIVGGESGSGARPMHPEWARRLRDQCVAAAVPFFFKQWGEHSLLPREGVSLGHFDSAVIVANDGTVYQPGDLSYPDGPRRGEAIRADHGRAALTAMYRVGKLRAGRDLDGRTWDEYPTAVTR